MLERSPEMISVGELRKFRLGNQLTLGQTAEADQSVRRPQPLIATSPGNLQGLCNKLNFANTAATQLDVETLLGPLALTIDLLLGHAYVSQCTGDTDVS